MSPELCSETAHTLRNTGLASEVLWLSTCNRVEFYGLSSQPQELDTALRTRFEHHTGVLLGEALYTFWQRQAIRHAFRVSASLDSLVVGEPQIIGQVKEALKRSIDWGSAGAAVQRWFTHALAVAKRVRRETRISVGSVSMSSVACDLSMKIFGTLKDKQVLLLGVGKMGEASARKLADSGAHLAVIQRHAGHIDRLQKASHRPIHNAGELDQALLQADVVITSTNHPDIVVSTEQVRRSMPARRHRPLFFIDLVLPRDVDPQARSIDNVFLYDMDDLQKVADDNLAQRQAEANQAEGIVDEEVSRFQQWCDSQHLTPTVIALREHVRDTLDQEVQRILSSNRHFDARQQALLKTMSRSMANKLLHQPLTALRGTESNVEQAALVSAVHQLFDLQPSQDQSEERCQPAASVPFTRKVKA